MCVCVCVCGDAQRSCLCILLGKYLLTFSLMIREYGRASVSVGAAAEAVQGGREGDGVSRRRQRVTGLIQRVFPEGPDTP